MVRILKKKNSLPLANFMTVLLKIAYDLPIWNLGMDSCW